MTDHERAILMKYLIHLNKLGPEGSYDTFYDWYQEVRYSRGAYAPQSLEEASELRYKDILDAARVYNRLVPGEVNIER